LISMLQCCKSRSRCCGRCFQMLCMLFFNVAKFFVYVATGCLDVATGWLNVAMGFGLFLKCYSVWSDIYSTSIWRLRIRPVFSSAPDVRALAVPLKERDFPSKTIELRWVHKAHIAMMTISQKIAWPNLSLALGNIIWKSKVVSQWISK
jgi:hypothetical protein